MYHSRLTFHSNQGLARLSVGGNASRFAGTSPGPRHPPLSRNMQPATSSNSSAANQRTPLEFELYQHAYATTRELGTRSGQPDLRAA